MTHDDVTDLLGADALGVLGPEDRARLIEHLRDCTECADRALEMREVVAHLGLLAPDHPLDAERAARVRARLLARAGARPDSPERSADMSHQPHDGTPVREIDSSRRRSGSSHWLGWAVAAGLASLLLTHHTFHAPLSFGWIAASVLGIVVVGLGIYVSVLRDRLSAAADRGDRKSGGRFR